jgi:hypothetical protein
MAIHRADRLCLSIGHVGPWLALQVLLWRRQREGSPVASLAERRASLETALRAQETSWPPTPRAGRYEPIDRQARGHLADLRRAVGDMAALWPALEGQTMAAGQAAAAPLAPLAVAALGAWRPMRAEWTLARTLRNAASLLEEGEEAVRDLQQLEHVVASIPQRMHAELRNHRAELERLSALLEAETDYGTADLDAKAGRLREIHHAVESALEALEQTQSEALPVAAAEIDARLDQIGNDLAALDRSIGEVAQARGAAQAALTRIGHGLQAAGVRWAELTAAGLSEPTIPQALAYLESERRRLELLMGGRTADAYHQVAAAATTIDEQFAALTPS